eukprot:gene15924-7258_t
MTEKEVSEDEETSSSRNTCDDSVSPCSSVQRNEADAEPKALTYSKVDTQISDKCIQRVPGPKAKGKRVLCTLLRTAEDTLTQPLMPIEPDGQVTSHKRKASAEHSAKNKDDDDIIDSYLSEDDNETGGVDAIQAEAEDTDENQNYDSDNDSEFLADDIANDCDSDEDMETR